jgi:hypothetical protein
LHLQEVAEFVERVWAVVGGNRHGSTHDLVQLGMLLAFASGVLWALKDFVFRILTELAPWVARGLHFSG